MEHNAAARRAGIREVLHRERGGGHRRRPARQPATEANAAAHSEVPRGLARSPLRLTARTEPAYFEKAQRASALEMSPRGGVGPQGNSPRTCRIQTPTDRSVTGAGWIAKGSDPRATRYPTCRSIPIWGYRGPPSLQIHQGVVIPPYGRTGRNATVRPSLTNEGLTARNSCPTIRA